MDADQATKNATHAPLAEEGFAGQGVLGSLLLFTGTGIAILAFIDRTSGLGFEMPRSWYTTPVLWYFFAFACFLGGMRLLRNPRIESQPWKPDPPGRRFESLVVYSKPECHLCDQAKDQLMAYRVWLPEIEEVDISKDDALQEQFGDQIPVVEIDGTIRFRGRVNVALLRRLIDATPPRPKD